MRRLILVGILSLALPAFAAEDAAPTAETSAPAETGSTLAPETEAAAPEVDPEVAEAEPVRPPVSADAVARRTFTTAVEQREPVDSISSLENDRNRVYYFTEFVGLEGRRVAHRWEHEGEVVAEVPIEIGGPRWRAYSSKSLDASRLGEWTVSVVDESGHVVNTDSFVYEEAVPEPHAATPAETPAATPAAPPAAPAPGAAPEEGRTASP